ncbi:hypothetical protein ACIPJ1_00550 [Microbacterium maritypicum]|uniref:hypothetical protein n=1 Tax=Microbacterium maritypicum TaxID=33918 RepID=UPI0037FD6755
MISPTPPLATSRRLGALTMVAVAVTLAGCAPTPAPTPTPTAAFASEEEAFAAAEATFRQYTAATNATDLADPSSFALVFEWLLADALSAARENYSKFHAAGITRRGASTFDTFTPVTYSEAVVTAYVCLDIAEVELFNVDGTSAVPPDRPSRQALEVSFAPAKTDTEFAISSTTPTESLQCG